MARASGIRLGRLDIYERIWRKSYKIVGTASMVSAAIGEPAHLFSGGKVMAIDEAQDAD
jgi:hypothetical protein